MTIADVLRRARHPEGVGGRTTCPIHRGDNPTGFQFRDTFFRCHVCGAHGSPEELARRLHLPGVILGLEDDDERPGGPWRSPPTRRILAALRAQSHAAARRAGLRYREADRWLYAVQAVLRAEPPDREGAMEVGMEWLAQQDAAEEILCREDTFRLVLRRFLT